MEVATREQGYSADPLVLDGNPYKFKETLDMGTTPLSQEQVQGLLTRMIEEWQGNTYDLTRRNCCHFAQALCAELQTTVPYPAWVNRLAETGAYLDDTQKAAWTKAQQVDAEYKITEKTSAAYQYAHATWSQYDEDYEITKKVEAGASATAAKISQINEDYQIAETAKAKAAELDEKYNISGNATAGLAAASSYLGSFWGDSEAPSLEQRMTEAAKAQAAEKPSGQAQ